MERKLAAVMIADVVGYSRLSEADEEGTRARFQAELREVFEPQIAERHGRLVKSMGDGILVDFHSVVDALRCAIDIQRTEAERNKGILPERRIAFRIGINLGDVIVEGDDIHGDGVNITERLQALAHPGGLTISGAAYDQVRSKLAVGYAYLGEQRFKNTAEPVRVYRVLMDPALVGTTITEPKPGTVSWRWPAIAIAAAVAIAVVAGAAVWWHPWNSRIEPAAIERMALPLPDKPSIAVLPFANMSDDPKQEYFADGLTDGLITELSQISGLFVIARNSTFAYKGKSVPPKQVSKELGVRYVLEGSVQRAGDRLRINAQLIDALSGGDEWAGKFDGSIADVFALQDEVTRNVANVLSVKVTDMDPLALGQQETNVPAAYDAFLRGWEHYRRTTPLDFARSIPYFEEAIRLDPNYGRPYAALAMIYFFAYDRRWWSNLGISSWEAQQRAQQYTIEAQKRPTSTSHQVRGLQAQDAGETYAAIAEFKEAIALDPSDSWSYAYLAWSQTASGRATEALTNIRTAIRLDPHYPPTFVHILGIVQLGLRQFDEAVLSLKRVTELTPDDEYPFLALAAAYGHLGRKTDAMAAVARYNEIRIGRGGIPLTVAAAPSLVLSRNDSNMVVKKGLRLADVPEDYKSSEFAAKNRLGADELRSLFYGHRLHGRTFETGEEHTVIVSANGEATVSGDWGELMEAIVTFEDDEICFAHEGGGRFCATALRNPGGSKAMENEFILLDATGAYPFSQVE